jgi:hypothetical protein
VPKLPALILRRADRAAPAGVRSGAGVVVPRPRVGADRSSTPVIRRGADALELLEVAPPQSGLSPGSLVLGFAVGAMVATRRLPRIRQR